MKTPRTLLTILTWLLIVAIPLATASGQPDTNDVEVFHCSFDRSWDVNYDNWPDHWHRHRGAEFADYVKIEIQEVPDATAGRALVFDLDGAAAAASTQTIHVDPRFSYQLKTRLKIEEIQHSQVSVGIDLLDRNGKLLQSVSSPRLDNTTDWMTVDLGAIHLDAPGIEQAVVHLRVLPGQRGDLHGRIMVDEVRLSRLPRMDVATNRALNLYDDPDDVLVTCDVSGIREEAPQVHFRLFDAWGDELASKEFQPKGRRILEQGDRAAAHQRSQEGPASFEVSAEWRPPVPGFGYYRVVVTMLRRNDEEKDPADSQVMDSRNICLAVMPPLMKRAAGEFGWSLPAVDQPLNFEELATLLPSVGINWVKLPVWFDEDDSVRGDAIVQFAELLSASDVEVIGILDHPPAESEFARRMSADVSTAELLDIAPSIWQPSLDPVMTRLAMRVHWWQLGGDDDEGFVAYPSLNRHLEVLKSQLFRFGQEIHLGLPWLWDNQGDTQSQNTWEFQQFFSVPAPDAAGLAELLSRPASSAVQRWVLIEPPPVGAEGKETRSSIQSAAREMVCQMVAAKQAGADAIFMPHPFHQSKGLMQADGTPGALLLPWRTTAAMLGGAQYLGQMQLPGGSENRVFLQDDGQVVMVVWNDQPVEEILFLGDSPQQFDVWGHSTPVSTDQTRQRLQVGPLPMFVVGLHEAITRWRMQVQFERDGVPSIFREEHANKLSLTNTFAQGVGGTLRIVVPRRTTGVSQSAVTPGMSARDEHWSLNPDRRSISLAQNESLDVPFDIILKGALHGRQPLRIDFDVTAERPYQFSVYRDLNVGLGNIEIHMSTHLAENGDLVVDQRMVNHDAKLVDFKCYLYAAGFRRQSSQVYRLSPSMDRKVYIYPDGEKLLGSQILLEAVEVGGRRVLRQNFFAHRDSRPAGSQLAEDEP